MSLDLSGLTVVTECATGAYSCTPAIAAFAGAAKVVAFGKDSLYGTFRNAHEDMCRLWDALGLAPDTLFATDRVDLLEENLKQADIVTNSGHLRPLDSVRIKKMKEGCVIPLMYESWEFRRTDVCLRTCQGRGIPVAGTNERHPKIGVFEYLGILTAKSLLDAGLALLGNNILLICDNDFAPYVEKTLKNIGANVSRIRNGPSDEIDAIIFAHTPAESGGTLDINTLSLPKRVPVCCQLWGNVNRSYFKTKWVPEREPDAGHMGLKLSSLGAKPVVRLQSGGLKVGELMARILREGKRSEEAICLASKTGYAQPIKLNSCQ